MTSALLEVEQLSVEVSSASGLLRAVDDVSFRLESGQTLGVVGESGCGKSVTALALMGLLPDSARRVAGRVVFGGTELTALGSAAWRQLRGNEMSMVFQEPSLALNPVRRIGQQIADILCRHRGLTRRAAMKRAVELLAELQVSMPTRRAGQFPHELSGGMCQRVMLAMALACRPRLLIADEPTTALDVTTQAQVLASLSRLTREQGTAVILMTHDLGVVAHTCDEVLVLYAGQVVEQAPVRELFGQPKHRYTQALLNARLALDSGSSTALSVFPGGRLDRHVPLTGCRYAPRCAFGDSACRVSRPELQQRGNRRYACLHPANS